MDNPWHFGVLADDAHLDQFSNEDWSSSFKHLFATPATHVRNNCLEEDFGDVCKLLFSLPAAPVRNDCLENDFGDACQLLFSLPAVPVRNNCLESDFGEDLKRLFAAAMPFYHLVVEPIPAGPVLIGNLEEDYSDAEEFSEDEMDDKYVPFYKVRAQKGSKKVLKLKSGTSRKLSRRHGRIRSKKIERQILKGGVYEGLIIKHGSYGPCGFEI